jgi:hypothetical protein
VPYSTRGWIHKAGNDGFIKVIEDAERSVLVGEDLTEVAAKLLALDS